MSTVCMQLYFQPKVDVNTETVIGYETLLRNREIPASYPAAKMERVYHNQNCHTCFLQWLKEELCQWLEKYPGVSLAINLAPRQLLYAETKIFLEELKQYANQLIIEITEDMPLLDVSEEMDSTKIEREIEETLSFMKDQGYLISLDDVGTGQNSLERAINYIPYLQQIKFSIIKCQRQNVSAEMIESFLTAWHQFAKENHLDVVIEGIEDKVTSEKLKSAGLNLQQGFYFGRPKADIAIQHS